MKSNLQIISGEYKGKKLYIPSVSRPSQNKSRIAIFNILENLDINLKNSYVWDVFAGSGAFGIECISRYNSNVIFSDISKEAIKIIYKNIPNENKYIIENVDSVKIAKKYSKDVDIFFLDPPYDKDNLITDFLKNINPKKDSLLIIETYKENNLNIFDWVFIKEKIFGNSKFAFYVYK